MPVDASAGTVQRYVEDCPVCCRPQLLEVTFERDGTASIASQPEE